MLDTKRLYKMARYLAYERAAHEGPDQLAQDLQQAGWIAYLRKGSHKHLWKDIQYAMLEEISRWLWACKRGRGRNRAMLVKHPLQEWSSTALDALTPERLLIIKEEYEEARKNKRDFPVREYKRKPVVRKNSVS